MTASSRRSLTRRSIVKGMGLVGASAPAGASPVSKTFAQAAATAPFTLARKSGWRDHPTVREFPDVDEIITANDNGIFLPRTLVFNELADAIHRAVQRIMLTNADIKASLDQAAAEVDRGTASYKG